VAQGDGAGAVIDVVLPAVKAHARTGTLVVK
jgi:hypothetical protein